MPTDRRSGDFGSKLREARERRGVSLREIADATKIAAAVLEGLERNDISRLPGGIFGRGFVRSYAAEVGLDPEQAIRDFIAAFPQDSVTVGHAVASPIEDHQAVESDRQTAATFVRLIALSIPIIAAVLYFGMAGRHSGDSPAHQVPTDGISTSSSPVRLPAESSRPAPAPSPTGTTATNRLTVELSVKRPCWISATVDGESAIERQLQPGQHETLEVRHELVMRASDGSALMMTLNGSEARPLGKAGETVTARISLTNFKDYLAVQ